MGNLSYRFWVIFFTLFLPLIIFINLLAFGNIFNSDLFEGDVYFGVSSIIDSFSFFQNFTEEYNFGLFTPQMLNQFAQSTINHITFGLPKFWTKFIQGDSWTTLFDSDFWSFNGYPLPNQIFNFDWSASDIFAWAKKLGSFLSLVGEYVYSTASWFYDKLGIISAWFELCVNMLFQPLFLGLDMVYMLAYFFYYLVVLLIWIVKLMNGEFIKPIPHNDNSSWQDIADSWQDTWDNISAKIVLPPLKRVFEGLRGKQLPFGYIV